MCLFSVTRKNKKLFKPPKNVGFHKKTEVKQKWKQYPEYKDAEDHGCSGAGDQRTGDGRGMDGDHNYAIINPRSAMDYNLNFKDCVSENRIVDSPHDTMEEQSCSEDDISTTDDDDSDDDGDGGIEGDYMKRKMNNKDSESVIEYNFNVEVLQPAKKVIPQEKRHAKQKRKISYKGQSCLSANIQDGSNENVPFRCSNDAAKEVGCLNDAVEEDGCLNDAVKEVGCLNDAVEEDGCLNDAVKEVGCLNDAVEEDGCFNDAVEEDGCVNNAVEEDGCLNDAVEGVDCNNDAMEEVGCLNDAVEEDGCVNNAVEEDGCLNDAAEEVGCLNDAVEEDSRLIYAVEEAGCLYDAVKEDGCLNYVVEDDGCLTYLVEEVGCLNDAVKEDGCLNDAVEKDGCLNDAVEEDGCLNDAVEDVGCLNDPMKEDHSHIKADDLKTRNDEGGTRDDDKDDISEGVLEYDFNVEVVQSVTKVSHHKKTPAKRKRKICDEGKVSRHRKNYR